MFHISVRKCVFLVLHICIRDAVTEKRTVLAQDVRHVTCDMCT